MGTYNKIIVNGEIKIDLTNDTITPESMLYGYSAHKSDGTIINGTLFENYPDNESLIDSLKDSNTININDGDGTPISVSIDYVNARVVYQELLAVNQELLLVNQELLVANQIIDDYRATIQYLLNMQSHYIIDSFGDALEANE